MYLTQSLHRNVQQTPHLAATIFGDRVFTWSESVQRIARLAAGLKEHGVGAGERVGILSLNSDRYHEILLATWWLGGVVNPVNVRWSASEIGYSLADCDTTVLFVDDAFLGTVEPVRAAAPCIKTLIHCGDATTAEGLVGYESLLEHGTIEDVQAGGDDLAGIFYTGGTTGFPKGVMLSHTNMLVSAMGSCATGQFVKPGGTLLHAAPMFHLADLAAWNGRNLLGGTHVMIPSFTPLGVIEAVRKHGCTDALLVPTMIQMLVDSPDIKEASLSTFEQVVYGASPISEGLLERVTRVLPHVRLTQAYGMTELSPVATLLGAKDHSHPVRRTSCGRAAPHSEVKIIDLDGHEVSRGEVGEITVTGAHVMLGYWNKPVETEAAIVNGWMRTGDGGRMDEDGYVYVVDRIKDMIVSGGENVYSAEVENAVATHPSVAACAVIGVPDTEYGERVHAVVVLQPGSSLTLEELRDHVKERIAGYKAPRGMELVESLPMSGAGKILKRELRQQHWGDTDRAVN